MTKQFYSTYPNLNALRAELSSDFIESEKYNKPQINANERRLIVPVHHEERKEEPHKSLFINKIIRLGTRMTRIKRIFTDNPIRAYPRQPLRQLTSPTHMALAIRGDPRSIVYNADEKIRYKWHFSSVTEKETAQ